MYKKAGDDSYLDQLVLVELTSANMQEAEKVDRLQKDIQELGAAFEPQLYIFRALLEATNNAIEHAYQDGLELKYSDKGNNRWYATASYDPYKESLRFFVYDQGAGIPASLGAKEHWSNLVSETLAKLGLHQHETNMIEAAFAVGRTRTDQQERGKGLYDMQCVLEHAGAGYLRVISGRGDFTLFADRTVEKHMHASHIGGTLVEWSIPIDAISDEGD